MNKGWRSTTLDEVVEIVIGRTPPRDKPEYWTNNLDRPFCTIADMTDVTVIPRREGVTALAEREGKARRVPAGSLLMSFKLTLGRVGFAGIDLFPNEAIAWLRCTTQDVTERYLALWLSTLNMDEFAGRAVKGKTLNGPSLRALPVSFPPLDEQRRIIDLTSAVDETIEAVVNVGNCGQMFRWAWIGELLNEKHVEQEGWGTTSVADAAVMVRRGRAPLYVEADGDLVINQKCIRNGRVDLGLARRTDSMTRFVPDWAWIQPGDSLINSTGTGTVGRAGFVSTIETRTTVDSHVTIVRPDSKVVVPKYLGVVLATRTQELERMATGSTNQVELGVEAIGSLRFPLPLLDEQRRIVSLLSAVDDEMESATDVFSCTRALRSALLADLLSGDHEIPAAYDSLLSA
jgi:type I restriction enzyme S subunit